MNIQPPEGKKFYGSVTVSERGQIVVPADARKDFNIKAGDKLLVFADLEEGLWIATFTNIQKYLNSFPSFSKVLEKKIDEESGSSE